MLEVAGNRLPATQGVHNRNREKNVTDIDTKEGALSRRALFGGAAALGAVAAMGTLPALAQAKMQTFLPPGVTPKPKGPAVFMDYDQDEINYAYDQAPWAPNQAEISKRGAQRSEIALARLGKPKRLAYGPTDIEKVDIYSPRQTNAPINVFIHGGAWRGGSAAGAAGQAELFVDHGAHLVAVDFNNVIETKGSLLVMADQVRRAIAWTYKNAASFGGDPNRIYVSGSSSGAHLAGVALTTDWQKDYGVPGNVLKGGCCASGMYELHPVSLSARASYANFDKETLEQLSSLRRLDRLNAPVVVYHGTAETTEFQRQNRDFAAAVKAAGKPVEFLVGQGYNHFEGFETYSSPYGILGRAVLEQMKLKTA